MSIALHKDTETTIRKYAKAKGIEAPEAANRLVNTATGRLAAVNKYAKAQKSKPKKGATRKGKNGKAKKAA